MTPRALSHPLPAGMRDLLPEEARRRRALARILLDHFALHGYALVTPPVFEFAEVLERGLGTLDPGDVLRFVEPESGEVAALRPDMTPQIARMVATRLAREPLPIRLCYEGTIVRRKQGRARRHRQVPQAGVELYGTKSNDGDLEVLELATSVVRALGLPQFLIDLGHASIARALLDGLSPEHAEGVTQALTQKDRGALDDLLRGPAGSALPRAQANAIAELPDLHGGGDGDPRAAQVFARARTVFTGTAAESPLGELHALWDAAHDRGLGGVLRVDLGEVRGFAYYTGMIFHILSDGPGEPIGAGGRYDDLLARFGAPMTAVGFALYLDSVAWARETAGISDGERPRVVVALGESSAAVVAHLRDREVAAVAHTEGDATAFARAWGFSHAATSLDGSAVVTATAPGAAAVRLPTNASAGAIADAIRAALT